MHRIMHPFRAAVLIALSAFAIEQAAADSEPGQEPKTPQAVTAATSRADAATTKAGPLEAGPAETGIAAMEPSAQVTVPAVLVLSKGRGMVAVTGEVTEAKLLQAFMACSRSGGCGPSGCGPGGCG